MKNEQTLVILSPGFPQNEEDSTCLPAQQALVRSLNRQYPGVAIVVIAFQYPFSGEEYKWNGNRIIPLNGRNRKRLQRWLLWYRSWRILRRLNQSKRLTGILSFWLDECAVVGYSFGRRKHVPHFTWLLGQDARPGNRYVKLTRPDPSSLVAMSDFLAKTFYENYRIRPQYVITNGIDPELYAASPAEKDIDVIGVGSLISLKQFDVFIRIIQKIQQQLPLVKVLICGEGPEEKKLQQLILENKLEHNISLAGEMDHASVLALMQRSKVMLHTSSYEGFSGACLESLYAGAHVISFFSPQDAWIRHWHIAANENEMIELALEILESGTTDYTPVLPYKMSDTAKNIMQLFMND